MLTLQSADGSMRRRQGSRLRGAATSNISVLWAYLLCVDCRSARLSVCMILSECMYGMNCVITVCRCKYLRMNPRDKQSVFGILLGTSGASSEASVKALIFSPPSQQPRNPLRLKT